MKQKKTILLVIFEFLAVMVLVSVASPTFAVTKPADLVPCSGAGCTWCSVFELLQNVFNTAALLVLPIVIIFIVYGGVLYIIGSTAGSDKQTGRAKDIVGDAIGGLIIILLSFVIVNAVVVGLTGAKIENFVNIDCSQIGFPQNPDTGGGTGGGGGGGTGGGGGGGGGGTGTNADQAKRDDLKNSGISVNKNDCPPGVPFKNVPGGCTSLDNTKQSTLDGVKDFNQKCDAAVPGGCNVTITAGSEAGHSGTGPGTHAGGDKVDIAATPEVTKYIQNTFTPIPPRGDGATQYKDPATGAIYAYEPDAVYGPHWDVKYP